MSSHRRRDRAIESVLAEYKHQQIRRTDRKDRRMTGPVKLKTAGIAPKTLAATAIPLLAGVVLLLLDKLAGAAIDDTLWLTLFGSSPALALGTYQAPAAQTVTARSRASRVRSQAGQVGIEAVVVVLVIVILVIVLLRLV
jgi:hypothetical protein